MVQLMEGQATSREVLSKKAFENWYFEYFEAEREFLEAKRSFEVKRRDVCLFLLSAYADWSLKRFGEVLRPEPLVSDCENSNPVDYFFSKFEINSSLRSITTRLLNQAFDEKFGYPIE